MTSQLTVPPNFSTAVISMSLQSRPMSRQRHILSADSYMMRVLKKETTHKLLPQALHPLSYNHLEEKEFQEQLLIHELVISIVWGIWVVR